MTYTASSDSRYGPEPPIVDHQAPLDAANSAQHSGSPRSHLAPSGRPRVSRAAAQKRLTRLKLGGAFVLGILAAKVLGLSTAGSPPEATPAPQVSVKLEQTAVTAVTAAVSAPAEAASVAVTETQVTETQATETQATEPQAAETPATETPVTETPATLAQVQALVEPAAETDPRFNTCKAARAQGYGPYRKGEDPEYGWYRDADSDGVVCE